MRSLMSYHVLEPLEAPDPQLCEKRADFEMPLDLEFEGALMLSCCVVVCFPRRTTLANSKTTCWSGTRACSVMGLRMFSTNASSPDNVALMMSHGKTIPLNLMEISGVDQKLHMLRQAVRRACTRNFFSAENPSLKC